MTYDCDIYIYIYTYVYLSSYSLLAVTLHVYYWYWYGMGMYIYAGCVLPFNNIASALLLERDYFKDPPDGCHLMWVYCLSSYTCMIGFYHLSSYTCMSGFYHLSSYTYIWGLISPISSIITIWLYHYTI